MKFAVALLLLAFVFVPAPVVRHAATDAPAAEVAGGPKTPQHLKIFRTPERRALAA